MWEYGECYGEIIVILAYKKNRWINRKSEISDIVI